MATVENIAVGPDGNPLPNAKIRIRLIASTSSDNAPGYVEDRTIGGTVTVEADDTGAWTVDLEPNDNILPADTYYEIVESSAGWSSDPMYIRPVAGGPTWLYDLLVVPPDEILTGTVAAAIEGVTFLYAVDDDELDELYPPSFALTDRYAAVALPSPHFMRCNGTVWVQWGASGSVDSDQWDFFVGIARFGAITGAAASPGTATGVVNQLCAENENVDFHFTHVFPRSWLSFHVDVWWWPTGNTGGNVRFRFDRQRVNLSTVLSTWTNGVPAVLAAAGTADTIHVTRLVSDQPITPMEVNSFRLAVTGNEPGVDTAGNRRIMGLWLQRAS